MKTKKQSAFAGALAELKPATGKKAETKPATKAGRGGKSNHPDYLNTTFYLKRTTHSGMRKALIDRPDFADASELVDHLIAEWLKTSAASS